MAWENELLALEPVDEFRDRVAALADPQVLVGEVIGLVAGPEGSGGSNDGNLLGLQRGNGVGLQLSEDASDHVGVLDVHEDDDAVGRTQGLDALDAPVAEAGRDLVAHAGLRLEEPLAMLRAPNARAERGPSDDGDAVRDFGHVATSNPPMSYHRLADL